MLMFYEKYHDWFDDTLFENALETRNPAIISFMLSILISFPLRAWIFGSYPAMLNSTILFWPLVKHFHFMTVLTLTIFWLLTSSLSWILLVLCILDHNLMGICTTIQVYKFCVINLYSLRAGCTEWPFKYFLRVVPQKVAICNWKSQSKTLIRCYCAEILS